MIPPRRDSGADDTIPATNEPVASPSDDARARAHDKKTDDDPEPAGPLDQPDVLRARGADRYRLGPELGRGGMGRVVEAFDLQLGRTVALKEVLPPTTGTRRFAREVQITARLEHPAIVPLYDAGLTPDGRPYYVMRRVTGRPLDELFARARTLDDRLVHVPNVLAAIEAIAHAHERGVIHRDLKPANILVGALGETVVIDWGLAKVIGEPDLVDHLGRRRTPAVAGAAEIAAGDQLQTQFGAVFGTPGFMPPEQARGEELGPGADVYALGACLYQLLAGKPPHTGKSATEMLASTHQPVPPVHHTMPAAPPALAAIVDKALALDPTKRYADAKQLAEDLRRWSTGQLVAAHRYSRRERLARFARRHKGALGATAIALAVVAVLAWVGVARIVAERDAANAARAEAVASAGAAEVARDREAARTEAMIAQRARSLLDDNPTEAIAVLREIAGVPRMADEVHAIAKAAVARGVAWAMESSPDITLTLALDATGKRCVQTTRDGGLRVIDLDAHRTVVAKQLAGEARAAWVGGGRVLVMPFKDGPPGLLDVATGAIAALPLPPGVAAISEVAVADAHPEIALVTFDDGQAAWLDTTPGRAPALAPFGTPFVGASPPPAVGASPPNAGTTNPPPAGANPPPAPSVAALAMPKGKVTSAAISRDGTAALVIANGIAVVVDRSGTPRGEAGAPGDFAVAIGGGSPDRFAAIGGGGKTVVEIDASPRPHVDGSKLAAQATTIPLPAGALIVSALYRGDTLVLVDRGSALLGWTGTGRRTVWELAHLEDGLASPVAVANTDALVYSTGGDSLRWISPSAAGTVHLPAQLTAPRFAARPGSSRVIAAGRGLVVALDLAPVIGHAFSSTQRAGVFVDDTTLLVLGATLDWAWRDLATNTTTPIDVLPQGPIASLDVDPTSGRVTVDEAGPTGRLLVFAKGSTAPVQVLTPELGKETIARIVPASGGTPGPIVYGLADGRVMVAPPGRPGSEIVKLDGAVVGLAVLAPDRFAAVSAKGECVRGHLGGAITRTRVAPTAPLFVALAGDRVLVAGGARLYTWAEGGAPAELVHFEAPLAQVREAAGKTLVALADDSVDAVDLSRGRADRLLAPLASGLVGNTGPRATTLLAGLDKAHAVALVDAPSLARWSLPTAADRTDVVAISPSGRRLLLANIGGLEVRDLPTDAEVADLTSVTNAIEDPTAGVLVWPWQQPPKP